MHNSYKYILGLNCAHDSSACLMIDGDIKVAIQEERLTRIKHYGGFPEQAIKYCLNEANLNSINQIDCIVLNQYSRSAYETEVHYRGYQNKLIINPSHHLLHAYYAYYCSGFSEAVAMVIDGSGYNYGEYVQRNSPYLGPPPEFSEMDEAYSLYHFRDGNIRLLEKQWELWHSSEPYFRFPSLGHMFSLASQYIFNGWVHAGKTMGLAPYGDSSKIPFQIITKTDKLNIDVDWILKFPKPEYELPVEKVQLKCDIAAKVQEELQDALLWLVDKAYSETKSPNLCYSGGVALNSVANGHIIRNSNFKNVFITPAANDSGIAIGAAMYGYHQLENKKPSHVYINDFHGRNYGKDEVLSAIQNNSRIHYEYVENSSEMAANDIAKGKIVGWFEGASEFGPRALGHRSILGDPRNKNIKDLVNSKVKFREPFRPYAASVLQEHSKQYFDIEDEPYMLVVASIHPEKRQIIPGVCHVDGTCRIQTVYKQYHGNYRKLIEAFHKHTKVPLVLNTSFNIRGEPIVETPEQALNCFLSCGIDALYMEGYRITKLTINSINHLSHFIPFLNKSLTLITENRACEGAWEKPQTIIKTRTGYELSLEVELLNILSVINGKLSCKEILSKNQLGDYSLQPEDMLSHLQKLQEKGLISFYEKSKHVS